MIKPKLTKEKIAWRKKKETERREESIPENVL